MRSVGRGKGGRPGTGGQPPDPRSIWPKMMGGGAPGGTGRSAAHRAGSMGGRGRPGHGARDDVDGGAAARAADASTRTRARGDGLGRDRKTARGALAPRCPDQRWRRLRQGEPARDRGEEAPGLSAVTAGSCWISAFFDASPGPGGMNGTCRIAGGRITRATATNVRCAARIRGGSPAGARARAVSRAVGGGLFQRCPAPPRGARRRPVSPHRRRPPWDRGDADAGSAAGYLTSPVRPAGNMSVSRRARQTGSRAGTGRAGPGGAGRGSFLGAVPGAGPGSIFGREGDEQHPPKVGADRGEEERPAAIAEPGFHGGP